MRREGEPLDRPHDGAREPEGEEQEDRAHEEHAHEHVLEELLERRREIVARLRHPHGPVGAGYRRVAGDLLALRDVRVVRHVAALLRVHHVVRELGLVQALDLRAAEALVGDDLLDRGLVERREALEHLLLVGMPDDHAHAVHEEGDAVVADLRLRQDAPDGLGLDAHHHRADHAAVGREHRPRVEHARRARHGAHDDAGHESPAFHRLLEVLAEFEVLAHHIGIGGHERRAGGVHHHRELDVGVGLHQPIELPQRLLGALRVRRREVAHEVVVRADVVREVAAVAQELRDAPRGALGELLQVGELDGRDVLLGAAEVVVRGDEHRQQRGRHECQRHLDRHRPRGRLAQVAEETRDAPAQQPRGAQGLAPGDLAGVGIEVALPQGLLQAQRGGVGREEGAAEALDILRTVARVHLERPVDGAQELGAVLALAERLGSGQRIRILESGGRIVGLLARDQPEERGAHRVDVGPRALAAAAGVLLDRAVPGRARGCRPRRARRCCPA